MSIFPKPEPETQEELETQMGSQQAGNGHGNRDADPVAAILSVLRKGKRFLVCSHARPDGDAVGSMLACGMLIAQMGKQADLVSTDPIPAQYRRLPGASAIRHIERDDLQRSGGYDALILLECDGLERAGLDGAGLKKAKLIINIDHHISGRPYADINWIDYDAASVGEMVYRLAMAADATLTREMATCLYTTVLTDTGGFCYGSVRASTFAWAEELVLAGADAVKIAQEVCFSTPYSKMQLLGAALGNLAREGPVSWLWVTHDDMVRTGAHEEDCEGIVNFALGITGVEAAVFLRELPDGHIRLSLRSKGKLSVAAIAESLGGGGHQNAAGCTLGGPLERARTEILEQLRMAMARPASAADELP